MELKKRVLKQVTEFLNSKYLTISNVSFFMQQIRLLLEINNTKKEYNVANHYCNWLFHKELNRSNSPIIIAEISNSFENFNSKNELIKNISETLSLKTLVTELKEILWNNLEQKLLIKSHTIYLDEFWLVFIRIILSQISNRPLLLKKDKVVLNKYRFSIYGVQIVVKDEKIFLEILSEELENKDKRMFSEIILYKNEI